MVIAAVMYIGFFASNIVLAGKSMHGMVERRAGGRGHRGSAASAPAIIGIIGYRFIHILNRIGTWVLGIGILVGFGYILTGDLPSDFLTRGGFNFAGWLATVSLGALWQIAFAPYVSDYSRYLPKDVGVPSTFWATYLGCTLGSILAFAFGAVVTLAAPIGMGTMDARQGATGASAAHAGAVPAQRDQPQRAESVRRRAVIITSRPDVRARWIPTARARAVLSTIILVAALRRRHRAVGRFRRRTSSIWWSCLAGGAGAVDGDQPHRLLRHPQGRLRHRVDLPLRRRHLRPLQLDRRITAYLLGIVVQIPFMATSLYTGPVSAFLGGADLSWVAGLVVTGPIYLLLARRGSTGAKTTSGATPVPARL